jgi:hypothetical protein
MEFKTIADAKRKTGLSYLGMVNSSAKHMKNADYNEMVYALYLAPANLSGYNVCPKSNAECRALCLHESGQNKIDKGNITNSRIKKTKLFFEHRQFFMQWLVADIEKHKNAAEKAGYHFSVRLNNTSDINPEQFYLDVNGVKRNILQLFPNVQFYDYTKVDNRLNIVTTYDNYDLTFSHDGYNWDVCEKMLKNNVRVAVVFKDVLPEQWRGHKVVSGDKYDVRFLDDKNVIVGLKFKRVKNKLTSDMKFVVQDGYLTH